MMTRALLVILVLSAVGCASTLPPTVLTQADEMPRSPALLAAQKHAPIPFAQAEKLRQQAHIAFEDGDFASAQILAEQALAAYEQAVAESRVQRAEQVAVVSEAAAAKAQARLAIVDWQQQTMAADITALNKQLQLLRTLELPRDSGKASAERARARREASATLRLQGQLLCTAARLLGVAGVDATGEGHPEGDVDNAKKALVAARAQLLTLDELLGKMEAKPPASAAPDRGAVQAPIDHAMRARAACLRALTLARRLRAEVTRAAGRSDALLADLAASGVGTANRDDRGVVVTLREVFDGEALAPSAAPRLVKLLKVAAKHGGMPLMVVLHQAEAPDEVGRQRAQARGQLLVAKLRASRKGGTGTVSDAVVAGIVAPLVDPGGRHKQHNARVEVVFVTPQG